MTEALTQAGRRAGRWLANRAKGAQWAVLMVLSVVFVTLLEGLHLPAALLLGPMVAGILVAAMDGTVRVPSRPFIWRKR